jgi:ABC-2 type transport system ATP-binding protein
MNVIECSGLGKRYRRTWALRDCALAIPGGRVAALVGPNGAGKTTLLHLAVGLLAPTTGQLRVLGGEQPGSPAALDGIGFVAQDTPLYRNLPVADMLQVARRLNRNWDLPFARARLAELGIGLDRKVGKLSGGQQAQLALTLAMARHPQLLVLDEPLAMLDPLARHDFMAGVMAAVADEAVTVVLSSHALAELERVADYLIVVSHGRVQVAGEVDQLLATHRTLTGPASQAPADSERLRVVHAGGGQAQAHLLVRTGWPGQPPPTGWESHPVSLEELVLAYLREPGAATLPGPLALATQDIGMPS